MAYIFIFLVGCFILRRLRPAPQIIWENEMLICISLGNLLNNERIYFFGNEIFICDGCVIKAHYPLSNLIYLSRRMVAIFGLHIWRLEFKVNGEHIVYNFYPKANGFDIFYKKLIKNYPRSVIDGWNKWIR